MATRERDARGNNCEVLGTEPGSGGDQYQVRPVDLKRRELAEARGLDPDATKPATEGARGFKGGSVKPL